MDIADKRPALALENVTIAYEQGGRVLPAVRDVSLALAAGETYGLVGESGSGKSTLALAVLRSLPPNGRLVRGSICLDGRDLLALEGAALRAVWARHAKLVPQNALSSLNPSLRIGEQVAESLAASGALSGQPRAAAARAALELVRLADPERVLRAYPHQLSGGMQQRVMIAMALAAEPELLVLDEPTTALDVTTEAAILDLVDELTAAKRTAVLFVSHNLGVVARSCDRVAVLYAGELVEDAPAPQLYAAPMHPYTQGLLASVPRPGDLSARGGLRPIPGSIPRLDELPAACVFAPRCPFVLDKCRAERPPLETPAPGRAVRCWRWPEIASGNLTRVDEAAAGGPRPVNGPAEPALALRDVEKSFALPRGWREALLGRPPRRVRAVDGVSLDASAGRTLGLVGESGSGKTTLARLVIGLEEATGGEMALLDLPLARTVEQRPADVLRRLQMVFQNPEEALNPYMTVAQTLRRPLMRLGKRDRRTADAEAARLLELVKLRPEYADRLPAQLSGGEKQRVAIARAFAAQPDLLLLDEAVSALDVSVQAGILNLLAELQAGRGVTYLFITHDLGVVSYLADEIAVIYLGHLMEVGATEDVFRPPYHPYTEALLSAAPAPDPSAQRRPIRLEGEVPSAVDIPPGCRFHTRCPRYLGDICRTVEPPWREAAPGHFIYCHIPVEKLVELQEAIFRKVPPARTGA